MNNKKIHFVGIGGIGMSALAQLYLSQGVEVQGSDRSESVVTELLKKKGADVLFGHKEENILEDADLLVYSDAIPFDNVERAQARELGIKELSYFEALGEATKEGISIVIAGTHGKTSTTAMLAKILIDLCKNPTVIAGSILSEYGSNFVEGAKDLFVIEGCEYKRHFLHLHPNALVITNIELDHTDYYKNLEDMQNAFREVITLLPNDGMVVANTESETLQPVLHSSKVKIISYQDVTVPKLKTSGKFNIENAQSAKTLVCNFFDNVDVKKIDKSLSDFTGTWRRFEYKGKTKKGAVVYDDYAHHPTAIKGTIKMAHEEFPNKNIIVIFHPHLYSRTKSFFNEFAKALSFADKTFLLQIYAAREKDDGGVSSEKLVEKINEIGGDAEYVETFSNAENILNEYCDDSVIITMGAGDVYKVGDKLCENF